LRFSRRGIDLTKRFKYVAKALASLPSGTVIDGELVALDEQRKPNFNLLQNFRSAESHLVFYAFDILIHKGHDLKQLPLSKRRAILAAAIELSDHVGFSYVSDKTAAQMVNFVRSHGLEGVVAKKAAVCIRPASAVHRAQGFELEDRPIVNSTRVRRSSVPRTQWYEARCAYW
jgi:bifunctional non-homologous end joining protein LigD